jgi:alpha-amylase/alpha-mannosidase (GH57 family)
VPVIRLIVLWHQHQPFYKDLVSGEYRLPWVRMHALKDYYGMVKLLDEFPHVHQNFNLVPSLMVQIEDYVAGTARDPFLQVASKPAADLTQEERHFALQYLFQANPVNMIGRYPRYRELWERLRASGDSPARADRYFQAQDLTDLQVLSQLAWFDEFFLEDPNVDALVKKGRHYSLEDQKFVIDHSRELLARVLPAHRDAAARGSIELSTSPFYHPILPLICDTNQGAVSTPGLPLPQKRFRHPEDAREQLKRGLDLHERVFGMRPKGVWPSEGSVSHEAFAIAHDLGVEWMATDEGVLGRSLGVFFSRDGAGRLGAGLPEKLYNIYRYEKAGALMHLVFRDHTISDLVGFVYSGMPPQDAANHLLSSIHQSARPVLDQRRDAVVSIILDGENAWEYYPRSGREFLRRFYDGVQRDPVIQPVTISEAIAAHTNFAQLKSLVPGSWINANFNVWIGAPEDNRSWDYLHSARDFYEQNSPAASEEQRNLAFEEILIAEGSDWNWWYGPEHHSANDREFDELYRKHLSNVYHALGAAPPENLAQPILGGVARPSFVPQTAYIHPRIDGTMVRYFEWIGAAMYTADRRAGAMHGKQFLVDSVYAGIDEEFVYGRLDFTPSVPEIDFSLVVNLEASVGEEKKKEGEGLRLDANVCNRVMIDWKITSAGGALLADSKNPGELARVALQKRFEFRLPLKWMLPMTPKRVSGTAERIRLRFSLWHRQLPIDALPLEGWIELPLLSESDLAALA